jgi:broad specificity phosphatase PhoE
MELYLIRHAQSTNNALTNQEDRGCDPPLTDLGRRQAELLAQHLATGTQREPSTADGHDRRGYGITQLYCSPMWRALQTAQPVGQALGLAPEVWIETHEQGGIYLDRGEAGGIVGHPGKTKAEILEEFPDYTLPEGITEQGWWNQGYEDRACCIARAIRVAQALYEQSDSDERIAIVSHAAFIGALLKAILNQLPGHGIWYRQCNTAISRIDFSSDGRLHVRYLNRLDHLPPELIT